MSIQSLNETNAREMAGWHYDAPYDFYNLSLNKIEQNIHYFLDPQNNFYGIFEKQEEFVGYCSFGEDGQVPGGDYSTPALDIGLGIRPDLTGQGWGSFYVEAVLDFARQTFAPPFVRVTVAAFNQRALRVWYRAGFRAVNTFEHQTQGVPFVILVQEVGRASKNCEKSLLLT